MCAWSRCFGNDAGVEQKRAASPLKCGHSKRLPMIRIGLYRLLTSCGTGVDASQSGRARNEHECGHEPRASLERVSDADLHLLESAARAQEQGRELTPAESAAAEAYASAIARESAALRFRGGQQRQRR